MKTTLLVFSAFIFFICFLSKTGYAQVEHVNLIQTYNNSLELPVSAIDGYNMFTDQTYSTLKPQYQQKLDFTKKYADSVKNYMMSLSTEMQNLMSRNDPLMYDTSMNYVHRDLERQNQNMVDLINGINADILRIEEDYQNSITGITDKSQKLQKLNNYMRSVYSTVLNSYVPQLGTRISAINSTYQQINYGESILNPITRMPVMADLYATVVTFVDWKNQIVKSTAQRLAKDYYEYTH